MKVTNIARGLALSTLLALTSGCSWVGSILERGDVSPYPSSIHEPVIAGSGALHLTFDGGLLRFDGEDADVLSSVQLRASDLASSPAMSLESAIQYVGDSFQYKRVHRFALTSTTLEAGKVELIDIGYQASNDQQPLGARIAVRIETSVNLEHSESPIIAHLKITHSMLTDQRGSDLTSAEHWQEMKVGGLQVVTWKKSGDLYALVIRLDNAAPDGIGKRVDL